MLVTKMIPLNSVLKDVYFLMREADVQEDLVMEFAIRAMESIYTYRAYEKAICFVRIENNQGAYPHGMLGIHGVLYNTEANMDSFKQYVTTHEDANGDDDIPKEERVQGYLDPNRNVVVWKLQNFTPLDTLRGSGWKYLPLSNHAWDKSIICHQEFVGSSCEDWYIPDNANSRFLTSFESGYLSVAYLRFPMNSDNEFLIPDVPEYAEAIESYVLMKIYQRFWHLSKQGADTKYKHYLEKWQWLSAAAVAKMNMLSLPEYINLTKQNKFFKDDSPLNVYGGYGRENMQFERDPFPGRLNYRR